MLFSGQHLSGHKICQVCGWSWIPSCLHCQQSTAMPCFGKVSCGTSTLPASRCSNHGLFDGILWFGETGHGKSDSLFRSSDIYSRLFVFLPNQSYPIDTTVGSLDKKVTLRLRRKGCSSAGLQNAGKSKAQNLRQPVYKHLAGPPF